MLCFVLCCESVSCNFCTEFCQETAQKAVKVTGRLHVPPLCAESFFSALWCHFNNFFSWKLKTIRLRLRKVCQQVCSNRFCEEMQKFDSPKFVSFGQKNGKKTTNPVTGHPFALCGRPQKPVPVSEPVLDAPRHIFGAIFQKSLVNRCFFLSSVQEVVSRSRKITSVHSTRVVFIPSKDKIRVRVPMDAVGAGDCCTW